MSTTPLLDRIARGPDRRHAVRPIAFTDRRAGWVPAAIPTHEVATFTPPWLKRLTAKELR